MALPPMQAVVRLSAPTLGVMLAASASNILHTFFVSRLGSEAIAAVSLVFPVSMLAMTVMAGGIGAGASSAVARALGANDQRSAVDTAEHAIVLSLVIGIAFGLILIPGAPRLFRLMGGRGQVLDGAVLFARVLFGGAAITFFVSMLDSILRGEGNVRIPAIWATTSLALQMVATPIFMFSLGMGLVGAPIATLTCQLVAAVPRAAYVFRGRGAIHPRLYPRHLSLATLREILRVGVPASLSTAINYAGIMVLTAVVARFGTAHLAAYGLGTRMDFLLLSLAYGVSASVLTLVGLSTGAGRFDRVRSYVGAAAAIISAGLTVLAALLFWKPQLWLLLFSDDAEILAVGSDYFRIIGFSYPLMGISMVIAFAFQGLGRATAPLLLMTLRVAAVVATALVCTQWLDYGDHAVFLTIAAGNVGAALAMFLLFRRFLRGM